MSPLVPQSAGQMSEDTCSAVSCSITVYNIKNKDPANNNNNNNNIINNNNNNDNGEEQICVKKSYQGKFSGMTFKRA